MSDFSCFDSPEALAINKARMDHFLSLGIPIQDKRVLEVGCGVGHLSAVLLEHGAMLFSIDARTENVKESGRRVTKPHHISAGDIQDSNAWGGWRTFDVVFAYGLLYHLSNPIQALCNMKTLLMPRGILALESIVIDHTRVDPRDSTCQTGPLLPIALLQDEESYGSNQGISNLAFWPSVAFIIRALKGVGFEHVYQPVSRPEHPEFGIQKPPFTWREVVHREIFLASDDVLDNPTLRVCLT